MDSNRLKYFLVVNETGSIRKAAELLQLSPAALSKAIKQFESELRVNLLNPSGRGIVITEAGKELARLARPHVEGLELLAKGIGQAERSNKQQLRLGSFEVFTTHFLQGLVPHLPKEMGLLLREVFPGEMEKALLNHEIDYGITYIPIPTAGIDHQQVATIEMGIFGLANKFSDVPFDKLPFVIPIQPIVGSPNKVQGLDGWPDDRFARTIKFQVTMMESALELCRQGKAVGYFPRAIVDLHNDMVKQKFQLDLLLSPKGLGSQKQGVFLSKRKSDIEGDIHKKVAKGIRLVCTRS
jgi:DNA-binding transcriptional LysR family regulator